MSLTTDAGVSQAGVASEAKRLDRIDALVGQGYRVELTAGAFPYLVSPVGGTIVLSLLGGREEGVGFAWVACLFAPVFCFEARVWSYCWVPGLECFFASLLRLMPGISIDLSLGIGVGIDYGMVLPYLRCLACLRRGSRQFTLPVAIVLGCILSLGAAAPSLVVDSLFTP
ncbi:MAG: hypothetical protein VKM34_12190 [Cyanobacteriota bacterium]|nr:hypothetical protein [Cyanobacteriota bacterium]